MSDEAFKRGDLVIHKVTHRKGVVVDDVWGVCSPDEVPVRYEGETGYLGTDPCDLENFFDLSTK